jgi:glutamine synthetase type III
MDDVVERVQDAVESDLEEIGKAVEDVQSGGDVIDAVSSAGEAVLKIQEDVGNAVVEDVSDVVEKLQEVVLGDDDASDDDKKEEKEENGDDEDKEE